MSLERWLMVAGLLAALFLPALPASAKSAGDGGSASGGGILPGATASDPVNIDADKLDYFDKEQKLIYSGSVIVVNGPSTLKISRMTIFLENKKGAAKDAPGGGGGGGGATSDKVRHVEGEGPVTLVSPDQIATGDHLTYDRADNKVHLTGNVTWTQGETVVKGEHLVYDLTTKEAQVLASDKPAKEGAAAPSQRIHSMFTPKNK
jgi:lipopolysaccharide export system protein LptA